MDGGASWLLIRRHEKLCSNSQQQRVAARGGGRARRSVEERGFFRQLTRRRRNANSLLHTLCMHCRTPRTTRSWLLRSLLRTLAVSWVVRTSTALFRSLLSATLHQKHDSALSSLWACARTLRVAFCARGVCLADRRHLLAVHRVGRANVQQRRPRSRAGTGAGPSATRKCAQPRTWCPRRP